MVLVLCSIFVSSLLFGYTAMLPRDELITFRYGMPAFFEITSPKFGTQSHFSYLNFFICLLPVIVVSFLTGMAFARKK